MAAGIVDRGELVQMRKNRKTEGLVVQCEGLYSGYGGEEVTVDVRSFREIVSDMSPYLANGGEAVGTKWEKFELEKFELEVFENSVDGNCVLVEKVRLREREWEYVETSVQRVLTFFVCGLVVVLLKLRSTNPNTKRDTLACFVKLKLRVSDINKSITQRALASV